MYQIIESTYEEKMAMYMTLPKEKLIAMLIECNRILNEPPLIVQHDQCEDMGLSRHKVAKLAR